VITKNEMLVMDRYKRKNIAEIKKFIKNTKYFFSGKYGIGINYFIGKKN
jgi:hypothetical protein